jgi:hypothetical protein
VPPQELDRTALSQPDEFLFKTCGGLLNILIGCIKRKEYSATVETNVLIMVFKYKLFLGFTSLVCFLKVCMNRKNCRKGSSQNH